MKAFKPHNKKCRNTSCRQSFRVSTPGEARATWCSTDCALAIVRYKQERARLAKEKRERADHRIAKESIKTARDYMKPAQDAFNALVRELDHDLPCISCGRHHQGQWHAGHYRTVGANPELRFERANCHKQCSVCNNHKSGDIVNYRANLAERIGAERLAWLEGPHEAKRYTVDDLKALIKSWRAQRRELVKLREGRS